MDTIQGHRIAPNSVNGLDHFYTCAECGQAVDMRNLEQVFHHEEPGHTPHPLNS